MWWQLLPAICLFLAAVAAFGGEADLAPGMHLSVPCGPQSPYTFSAYVPAAYAQTAEPWPVLFLSSPMGNPAQKEFNMMADWQRWAEAKNVLIVGINDSRNGLSEKELMRIQDAVLAAASKQLRLHPYQRFSSGPSGGAMASAFLAQRQGDRWSGVLMLIHGGNGQTPAAGVPTAFLVGEEDQVYPFKSVQRDYFRFREHGNPVRCISYPGLGHGGSPTMQTDSERMMDWMLDRARLVHPRLDATARKAARALVQERLLQAPQIVNPDAKLEEHERLVLMPDLRAYTATAPVIAFWFAQRLAFIATQKDLRTRHFYLRDLETHPAAKLLVANDRQALKMQIADCRSQSPIKEEWAATVAFAKLPDISGSFSVKEVPRMVTAYRTFASRHSGTEEALRATQIADSLDAARKQTPPSR